MYASVSATGLPVDPGTGTRLALFALPQAGVGVAATTMSLANIFVMSTLLLASMVLFVIAYRLFAMNRQA